MDIANIKRLFVIKLDHYLKVFSSVGVRGIETPKVIILTTFGKIECDLYLHTSSSEDQMGTFFHNVELSTGQENVPTLHLKNATITSFSTGIPLEVEDMIIFTDQIVGLSFK